MKNGEGGSFWTSVTGVLTAVGGLIGAVAALLVAVHTMWPGLLTSTIATPTPVPPSQTAGRNPGGNPGFRPTVTPPEQFRVIGATLTATPAEYIGVCPMKVVFNADIRTVGGFGEVSYRFTGTDAGEETQHVVRAGGIIPVQTAWVIRQTKKGSASIEIPGANFVFPRASFAVQCR